VIAHNNVLEEGEVERIEKLETRKETQSDA